MISDQEASCWSLEIDCAKALQGGTNSGLSTGDCLQWKQADLNSPTRDVTARCSLVWPLPVFGYVAEHNEKKCESKCNPGWQDSLYLFACLCVCAFVALTILCLRCFLRSLMNSLCCLETKLTAAYSSSAANTNSRQTAIQMSMAFT